MKRFFIFILVLSLLFVVSCKKQDVETGENTITESSKEDNAEENKMRQGGIITVSSRKPDTFNPLATNYESCRELFYLFYDGLFTLNEDFTVKANLATGIKMSEDGLECKIDIKEGVNFADGSRLTAHDVIYSVEFIRMNGGSYAGCVSNIKNIEAEGTHSISIDLYSPEANFASMLTFPVISDGMAYYTDFPNGTGQFRCKEGDVGYTSLTCMKNNSYHLGRPYIDEIKVLYTNTDIKEETIFLSGETDLVINSNLSDEKAGSNITVYEAKSNRFEFIGFNTVSGIFTDESARKAIFASCDRTSLKEKFDIVKNPASTPVNPAAYFYTPEVEHGSFEPVGEFLEKNGWSMGRSGVYEKNDRSFAFTILVNEEDSGRVGIANFLSHSLLNYGISADVEILSYSEYKERLTSGKFDAFIGGCTIGNAANYGFLLGTGGSANVFGYSGGVMDMRISALASAKGDNLVAEAKKFGKAMAETAPIAGIYFKNTEVMAKKNIIIPHISPTGVYVEAYSWFLV